MQFKYIIYFSVLRMRQICYIILTNEYFDDKAREWNLQIILKNCLIVSVLELL